METFEEIMNRIMNRIPNSLDKREGSIIYDAVAPVALELANTYIEMDRILNEGFADTATFEYLRRRAEERGINPYMPTYAVLKLETTPVEIDIPIGERFNIETLNYVITEKITDGEYMVRCETIGTEGNVHFGFAVPIGYIEGLETCEITELLIPAEDQEETEHLRKRYFDSFDSIAFGGNRADYHAKVVAIAGVGGCKLYRTPDGGGSVGITIINSEYGVPSSELVELVQTLIDPEVNQGDGIGLAPIGHTVTVSGVTGTTVNINTDLTFDVGFTWDDVEPYVLDAIDEYFLEIGELWESLDNVVVRLSQLEARILSVNGVLDIDGTTLNGVAGNLTLNLDTIPVRGAVNVS